MTIRCFLAHRFAIFSVIVAALWGLAATPAARAQTDTTQRINFDDFATDADKPLYLRYGVFGSWNFLSHIVKFAQSTDCPTCLQTNFLNASGNGIGGGLLVEYPIWQRLGLSLRLSYLATMADNDTTLNNSSPLVNRFKAPEKLLIAYKGSSTLADIEHRYNPILGILGVEPFVTYRPLDALTLYAGAHIGFLLQKQYKYNEFMISPDDAVFENNRATRNYRTGEIIATNTIVVSPAFGLGYEVPLNSTGTWLLAPEAMYFVGNLFGGMINRSANAYTTRTEGPTPGTRVETQDGSWYMNNIRASLALKYSPYRTIRPELTPELQDKIRQLKRYDSLVADERRRNAQQLARVDSVNRAITAKMEELKKIGISVTLNKVVGVDENGTEIPKPTLKIEQFRSQIAQPLLPYIFFDDNSAVLPSRYRRVRAAERNGFKIKDFAGKSNVELYRHILNIIGQRMNDLPTAVLFLTGCNSGQGAEANNTKLSEQRATAISDYLQDVWKIPAKRIVVQKQNLSDHPSGNDANGQAENRRVEMSSNVPELFDPVKTDQVARLASPPTLRFGLEINAGAGLKQWDMEINQFVENESVTLKTFGGGNTYPPSVEWNLNKEPNTMPASGQDLSIQLTMTDINNKTGDAPITSIPVQQISVEKKEIDNKADKRIDIYDILGFDVTGNALDEAGQKAVEVIKKSLQAGANVIITGYSDAAGSKDAAQRRADLVAKGLGKGTTRAAGPTTENDNALAEGRFYNRYVHVEVQTPVR